MVAKLPFRIRENVSSMVSMTLSQAENVYKDLEVAKLESSSLRAELSKKTEEIIHLKKSCNVYQTKAKQLEGSIETLKDTIDTNQRFSVKNRSAVSKLASTNRMLIDSLDALQAKYVTTPLKKANSANRLDIHQQLPPLDASSSPPPVQSVTSKRSAPISLPVGSSNPNMNAKQKEADMAQAIYEETEKLHTTNQNDKLRESLLRVAREHYKSMKNGEALEAKVAELRASLRNQEQLNRKIKSEMEELKASHAHDNVIADDKNASNAENNTAVMMKKEKKFGILDQKLKALLDRNAFDPIDGIQTMRRLMAHLASAPQNLNQDDTIKHIVNREVTKAFDTHMISLFLLKPQSNPDVQRNDSAGPNPSALRTILKYNVRSDKPVVFETSDVKSFANEVLSSGKMLRVNSVHHNNPYYNVAIDGCNGVICKRMIYFPLYNTNTNTIIGCLQLINKGTNNEGFAEIDELFGLLYADQVSLLLTNCNVYNKIQQRSALLQHLLESSTSLYAIIPDAYPRDIAAENKHHNPLTYVAIDQNIKKTISVGDVILKLEAVCKDILKCVRTRVFLVSDGLKNHAPGHMIQLQHNKMFSMTVEESSKASATVTVPATSGIAGHVIQTKHMYQQQEDGFDPYVNPTIDLESASSTMITIPIMTVEGVVLGCLQCVCSTSSPPTSLPSQAERKHSQRQALEHRILFQHAATWLCHQLSAPIVYLIRVVNSGAAEEEAMGKPEHIPKSILSTDTRDFLPLRFDKHNSEYVPSHAASTDGHGGSSSSHHHKAHHKHSSSGSAKLTAEVQHALERTEKQLEESKAHSEELALQVKDMEAQLSQLTFSANQLDASNQNYRLVIEESEIREKEYKNQIAGLDEQIAQLNRDLQHLKEVNESQRGKTPPVKAGSSASLTRGMSLSFRQTDTSKDHQATIDKLTLDNKQLTSDVALLNQQITQLKESVQDKDHVAKTLHDRISQYEHQVKTLQESVAAGQHQMQTLSQEFKKVSGQESENAKRLTSEVATLKASLAEKTSKETKLTHRISELEVQLEKAQEAVAVANHKVAQLNAAAAAAASNAGVSPKAGAAPTAAVEPVSVSVPPSRPLSSSQKVTIVEPNSNDYIDATSPVPDPEPSTVSNDADWVELMDENNNTYYYNSITGETSWTKPSQSSSGDVSAGGAEEEEDLGDWIRQYDENGREYFLHQISGESVWEIPKEESGLGGNPSIYDTQVSQYSATAGDYTIEL